jgi:hypothetical protein
MVTNRYFTSIFLVLGLAASLSGCAHTTEDETSSADGLTSGEKYYAFILGYENQTTSHLSANDSAYSHTFATYVRARVVAGEAPSILDRVDISWLPAAFSGTVCVDAFHVSCPPEEGHNYELAETLGFARTMRDAQDGSPVPYRLAAWGPYAVQPDLFARAKKQAAFLTSAYKPNYVANDLGLHFWSYRRGSNDPSTWGRGPTGANNCIHAVTDLVTFERTGLNWGINGSLAAINITRPFIAYRDTSAEWLAHELGLDESDVERDPTR